MASVSIIDYGVGNIRAFVNIYDRLGIEAEIARKPEDIRRARRLILPGVGAFDWAMTRLNESGLREVLDRKVLEDATPVIGVCVGMQMMANCSEEGKLPGLGWVDATVERLANKGSGIRPLPHMGWNGILPTSASGIFAGLTDFRFYFLHSYAVVPKNKEDALASTEYGLHFVSAVKRGSIFGVQFHPEKSHHWGIGLLRNFAAL